ncbi:MAG: hypothetical protein KGI57_10855 [Hyphomicrobiales bacterium]|nr:hypothetical protein [Hyphomicrobiales bacterium]MDE2018191.1 hypothetical protein [Hyphomicrobiales bacterium]
MSDPATMPAQPDLLAALEPRKPTKPAPGSHVAPEEVRPTLQRTLDEARRAETHPWDARKTAYWRLVFPQMCNWLPAEERDRMRAEFAAEMARLDAA